MATPKLYQAERGTPGSIHHVRSLFLSREEADAAAEQYAGYWGNHPAAREVVLSDVTELTLTPAERRVVDYLKSDPAWPYVFGEGTRRRTSEGDVTRLESAGAVAVEAVEEYDEVAYGKYRQRILYRVRLTDAGRGWLGMPALAEGGVR